ncbi:threonine ammonia-lyase [Chitinasiproducens palmae]|uniref:Threonine dehydratase n=1 Tax=Chitinasiproducens palmae TaxID=1770053 RepID=A0A1H2PTN5_9BURK|nr:pyridoxal-phosphate dependent enzyme [Chitinasiproducens palmae]SDV50489.1 threonine dehydratase [Chitinasiproducens palmae]
MTVLNAPLPEAIGDIRVPTFDDIARHHHALAPWVVRTPVFEKHDFFSLEDTPVQFKFEMLQLAGTFRTRAAFSNMLTLTDAQRSRGVVCVSMGDQAVAVAYAARRLGVGAKAVMLRSAPLARVEACARLQAEIVFADDGAQAYAIAERLSVDEGLHLIHPFSGYQTTLGNATLGYEWATQSANLDALILPVGSGGLAASVALAFRYAHPDCEIFGVEPEGANVVSRSLAAGYPVRLAEMNSIADSLMTPFTETYSFELCRRLLSDVVTVSDMALANAMLALFEQVKLGVEPSCAAPLAALLGPLRTRLAGRRVGLMLCGSNISSDVFSHYLQRARTAREQRN